MLRLRKVAVTGGLSCGKSSVCRIFSELGAYVVSADKVVHQLLSSDTNLGLQIIQLLGPDVLVNQKIDRSLVARRVFNNLELLKALEEIVHPAVYKMLDEDYLRQKHQKFPPPLFVAEIPLLFESGGKRDYEETIAVLANPKVSIERFTQTTGHGSVEYDKRMQRQLPLIDKAILADYVILNNGTFTELHSTTRELYQELIENK